MTEPLVAAIDHVLVPVADPEPHLRLFTDALGLPVAWPVADNGVSASGAVCLGNMNLEFIRGEAAVSPYFSPTEPLTARGIAFDPAIEHGWAEALDARGLTYDGPVTVSTPGLAFTNTYLRGLVADAALAFLCHYHGAGRAMRGATARDALRDAGGGAIGVLRCAEITLGLNDIERAMDTWGRLLAPSEPDAHGAWHLGDGPALRIKESPIDGVAGIWLEVASLADARDALRERELLGPMRASGIGLNYSRTGGLDVWLTEPKR